MDKVSVSLTVFFEEPFWVGVVQRVSDNRLTAAKITFGAEPKDYEVADRICRNRNKIPTGIKASSGADEDGTHKPEPGEKRG